MSKKQKRRRMTERDIQMIVEEIEAWGRGERGKKLTWAVLEKIFPFTRQTMFSRSCIKESYCRANLTLKNGTSFAHRIIRDDSDLEIQRLKSKIKNLELQIDILHKEFILKDLK